MSARFCLEVPSYACAQHEKTLLKPKGKPLSLTGTSQTQSGWIFGNIGLQVTLRVLLEVIPSTIDKCPGDLVRKACLVPRRATAWTCFGERFICRQRRVNYHPLDLLPAWSCIAYLKQCTDFSRDGVTSTRDLRPSQRSLTPFSVYGGVWL